MDDAALVRAARDGDRGAFMRLVALHQAGVLALAYGLTADRGRAEDVAQEAFLKAWRGLGRFRGDASFSTWLYTITRRVVLDEVRRPAVRTVPVDEVVALADQHTGDPDLRGDLDQALQALDRPQREAFLLVAVLGLSYREVAEMTGCPAGTVASRVFRARGRLAAELRVREEGSA